MNNNSLFQYIASVISAVPSVIKYLDPEYKTYDYFLARITGLVRGVYGGNVGGDFVDILGSLIKGQMADAYRSAWADEGNTGAIPDYLVNSLDNFTTANINFDWIYQYYKDIADARIDKTSVDPLLSRAALWANRYAEAYNEALRMMTIEGGGNMIWLLGATEEHCPECKGLNGKVMSAKEWQAIGVRPQSAPNPKLTCEGWRCDCSLVPTDKRRTPGAYGKIEELLLAR